VLAELARAARAAAGGRDIVLIAEDEPQRAQLLRPPFAFDGAWNDDFHHASRVALTGRKDSYLASYRGSPQELVSAAKRGFLYQGQRFVARNARRGAGAGDLPSRAFVTFIENHDQVSNSLRGERLRELTSPGRYRAMTTFFLLVPGTPMLFQGQERGSRSPFVFFADHEPGLAKKVREGRFGFLSAFGPLGVPEVRAELPDPSAEETFRRCKLAPGGDPEIAALYKDLLALRRNSPSLRGHLDGAVLAESAFVLRFSHAEGERLLVVNLGREISVVPSEPLLAAGEPWQVLFSSEDPRYGGSGTLPIEPAVGPWRLPAECAVLLGARR
jgi:maltooligosyltrehalose trehalohydrolase